MNLTIINKNGYLVTESREVAQMVGKRHSDLLESIDGYVQHLTNGDFRSSDFFIPSTYQDGKNETRPCYLLTRKGCDMVANKMTGEKGVLFTAAYVTKFEEMEHEIKKPKQLSAMEQLRLQYQVIEEHDKKIDGVVKKVDDLQANMPLFNVECKELQAVVRKIATKVLGGYKTLAYSDNSLRGKVYSDIQHQLRREFGVERYEAIKRCQLDTAKKIISEYKAPLILENEIEIANKQVSMDEVACTDNKEEF
jgi:Rha family phage regulatory protein